MSDKMYGVVLWVDHGDGKAVVWCEDQGDLAFYREDDRAKESGAELDTGDLIQFELVHEDNLRRVRNPSRLVRNEFPFIAQTLRQAERLRVSAPQRTQMSRSLGTVVAFPGQNDPSYRQKTLHIS